MLTLILCELTISRIEIRTKITNCERSCYYQFETEIVEYAIVILLHNTPVMLLLQPNP